MPLFFIVLNEYGSFKDVCTLHRSGDYFTEIISNITMNEISTRDVQNDTNYLQVRNTQRDATEN